jgi:DNA polymerase-3 subunit delta
MKLRANQLAGRLQKNTDSIYLISGDEPLQVQETADQVCSYAHAHGFDDREVFNVERGFDWNLFRQSSEALSLFSEKRILELRIPTGKPGDAGRKAILDYLEKPSGDLILLIITCRLSQSLLKAKWLQAVDQAGLIIQVWPVEREQLPAWITSRMRGKGLQPTTEAVKILVERVEGNMMAAAQEIDKLLILHGPGNIDAEAVTNAVTDSARYDIYKLADAALSGDAVRSARLLEGLRLEGIEPVLILWSLVRELRQLSSMVYQMQTDSQQQVLTRHRVWQKRIPLFRAALGRMTQEGVQQLLLKAGHADRVIKGAAAGNAWDELIQLVLQLAGTDTGVQAVFP